MPHDRAATAAAIRANPLAAYRTLLDGRHAEALRRAPEHMHEAIALYVALGVVPGAFLSAVLQNDLCRAVAHADETNMARLRDLVAAIWNGAPAAAWGSPNTVATWVERGGLLPRAPEDAEEARST